MHILLIVCLIELASAGVRLTTKSGPIQGVTTPSEDVEAFLGIPYAEPPVGELRFAKPVPKKQWNETYDASSMPPPCVQLSADFPIYFMPDITNMSENCLFLNMWVPNSKYNYGLRPIIIFIHGGSYYSGSSNFKVYDGTKLASRGNVIAATINYRLGALGFFLAYIEEAAGNMGMYDQVMAIKWIKDNAEIFGGDPENIVLMGESAGAFSITAHLVSPLSKSLFKRVIMESGSAIHPYYSDDNARISRNSKLMASIIGCTNKTANIKSDAHAVVHCLKSKTKEEIVEAEKIIMKSNPVTFFPRVNDDFLPKPPVDLFLEGKFRKDVDVLIGINSDEGSIILVLALSDYFANYGKNSINISKTSALFFTRALVAVMAQPNASEIIDFYLSRVKNRTSTGYAKMIADAIGDFVIACSTIFQADFLSLKGNPVYFYQFDFRAASTPTADWVGVSHIDELQYVFGNPFHDPFTAEEIDISNNLIDRWSVFARTGNPNVAGHMPWLRYSYHNPLYLNFGQEEDSMRMNPLDQRCEFWRKRFKAEIDTLQIRFLRNSGLNITK